MKTKKSFWDNVLWNPFDTTKCWLWIGTKFKGGYGRYGQKKAHIVSYLMMGGVLTPEKPLVLHKCHLFGHTDKRNCVNPRHLVAGTQSENVRDAVLAGTHSETRKTHCPKGHEYTPENTWSNGKKGARLCKACKSPRHKKWCDEHPGYWK